ncbi:diphosphomevalonate decarboxylase [Membranihabitans marinus]
MVIKDFTPMAGTTQWESPSNIALVKYWGKMGNQIPRNPSVSFTLQNCVTRTQIDWFEKKGNSSELDFYFEGKLKPSFGQRIQKLIATIAEQNTVLNQYSFRISSTNTFPHSSGIASSASAMSACAAGIIDMLRQIREAQDSNPWDEDYFKQQISFYSRLGSGSACRSIYPNAALWGEVSPDLGSNLWATPLDHLLHDDFRQYQDAIVIVDDSTKSVSSTMGHGLMNQHVFSKIRFEEGLRNTETMLNILRTGDISSFIDIVEREALQLHAMMMTSNPSYILIKPNTLAIIEKIRQYRQDSNVPLCFTLDAGPNVHILYPFAFRDKVKEFIETEIIELNPKMNWIADEMGLGTKQI